MDKHGPNDLKRENNGWLTNQTQQISMACLGIQWSTLKLGVDSRNDGCSAGQTWYFAGPGRDVSMGHKSSFV